MEREKSWRRSLWVWTGFGKRDLYDWLQLLSTLAIPVALTVATLWFTAQQEEQQRLVENRRADLERNLVEQRAQEAALQTYLDQMGTLLLEKDLRSAEEDSEVLTLARARTASVIQRLDWEGNRNVLRFLSDAGLTGAGESSISLLTDTRLSGTDLKGANLEGANLYEAHLYGANLSKADLSRANLQRATLGEADLSGAFLIDTDLDSVEMQNADLHRAALDDAAIDGGDLRHSDLSEASLYGAGLFVVVLRGVNLSGADLRNANIEASELKNANFQGADLRGAGLRFCDLKNADFRGADLSDADLSGAYNVSIKRLEEEAKTLRDATMPNGQKYEDWLEGGRYIVDKFEPAFRFEAGKGWQLSGQTVDAVYIEYVPEGASPFLPIKSQLLFTSPLHVFDPSNLSELERAPAPENANNWVSWFQRHPNLDTSKPVPVSVGGASGMRIDVTATSTPENNSRHYCGPQSSCVPLYPSGDPILKETKNQYIIVDEKGKTVVINVSAPADKFDEFLPKAQEVLDSVEWKAANSSRS